MAKPVLRIIIGSTRPGRVGPSVAAWIAERAREHGGFDVEVTDLAELNLPLLDEPNHPRLRRYLHQHTKDWSALVESADAFIFVTPEYNYAFNAALKNAIDYLHGEWASKAAGIVSYGGVAAGTRATQMLKQVLTALRMMPVPEAVNIPFVAQHLDENRRFKSSEVMEQSATAMLDEVLRWTEALRPLRAQERHPQVLPFVVIMVHRVVMRSVSVKSRYGVARWSFAPARPDQNFRHCTDVVFVRVAVRRCSYTARVINSRRISVVMPAYNAETTLSRTLAELDRGVIDEVVLVDDASTDRTVPLARELGLEPIVHKSNKGYGGNQKTCYRQAIDLGADVIVMVHPDYQYSPLLVPAMASMIAYGEYDMVLGSRILAQNSVARGMPRYKYVSNRFLTLVENMALSQKLSEYHTGFRAFSTPLLASLPFERNSDDFVFDNQIIAQAVKAGARIGEVSCPTRYAHDSSSINLSRSIRYGLGVLGTCADYRLNRYGRRREYLDFEPAKMPDWTPAPDRGGPAEELRADEVGTGGQPRN